MFVQTTSNDLEPIEYKRRLAMERIKKSSHGLARCGFKPKHLAQKNNRFNQSIIGFTCTTTLFRRMMGIKKNKSPRSYATREQLNLLNALEEGAAHMASTLGQEETVEQLMARIDDAAMHAFEIGRSLGIHRQILLSAPTQPLPASELPISEQFLGIEGPPSYMTINTI